MFKMKSNGAVTTHPVTKEKAVRMFVHPDHLKHELDELLTWIQQNEFKVGNSRSFFSRRVCPDECACVG
jgi:hypothetical protein